VRKREPDQRKRKGIHYTPSGLAAFLAEETVKGLSRREGEAPAEPVVAFEEVDFPARLAPGSAGASPSRSNRTPPPAACIRVLDPACGDGGLLKAFAEAIGREGRGRLILTGYETDPAALEKARAALLPLGVKEVLLHEEDFLVAGTTQPRCDAVISNPPYVRTQVLGARQARRLATRFGLTGRVDLYQAFSKAMAAVLRPGGVLGLLTSNRFLSVKAGASSRSLLLSDFELLAVYDLGDTKLFDAAVLPAIVVARKGPGATPGACPFVRVYEQKTGGTSRYDTVLDALRDPAPARTVTTRAGAYRVERGTLAARKPEEAWTLSTGELEAWLGKVRRKQAASFGGLAKVRVGIKTTADEVFIRDDWDDLSLATRPEEELLWPLLTHHTAARWRAVPSDKPRRVLYPHADERGRCVPIDLDRFPRAAAYLEAHRRRLASRRYVVESGRRWYEVWVPHRPADWSRPKIVFPDIAEAPRFFLGAGGAIVNGDCYWITLKDGVGSGWLALMLAVANSSFITSYYDARFHNKLYSGRRRFMTQYVNEFPLPDPESPCAREIVRIVSALSPLSPLGRRPPAERTSPPAEQAVASESSSEHTPAERTSPGCERCLAAAQEGLLDRLVWEAFGLAEEIDGGR
jgi:SAM-dependent methyltransferase